MLETDENVNEEAPEGDAPAADEAPDQVAEEIMAPEEPAEEPAASEVAGEPATEDSSSDEVAAEAPAEDAPAEEPATEEPAAAAAPAAAPAADAEPAEALGPKERRRRKRSAHAGEARPARTVEERAAERAERRSTKAKQRRAYRLKQRERRGSAEPRDETPQAPVEQSASGGAKTRQGIVVSDKADKTIIVRIDSARAHRMYKKIVRTSSTLHAHDEQNEAHVGDTVRLIESRPLSRTKRWRLVEVLERAR
jgi:small subunit ribosomal protein S17